MTPRSSGASPVSKKAQVVQACLTELHDARDGERLPGVAELCARHEVSTATAVAAMRTLIDEGLVVSVQGAGGGYFKAADTKQDAATVMKQLADDVSVMAGTLEGKAAEVRRLAASALLGERPILDAVGDALATPLTHWSVHESDVPDGLGFHGERDPTLTLRDVRTVRIRRDVLEIIVRLGLDEELLSRDALQVAPSQAGIDLESNAPVTVSREFYAIVVTGSAAVRSDGRIRVGKIRDVELFDEYPMANDVSAW